ncbi:phosphorylase family protein [Celerinatantimonas diazotrophica]|uniref:Phosphorylase superfamily protein n=1 Tax=Celerinatantimonas diazotrophica TaxID=412034 RepID=A0A4R1K1S9_9GAMM|nr:effector-associated domain EAD1-containing protein [Celerinatantimonas diazotrophica]TCK57757.1 phosphorylase superfamily protein [Celerinatantimonas diazotrophica]CAG9298181.1 5'-methylthioadenosine/S-adenosylhomocysteine nucleosidase [Celerinatantimonas diazotrophica]
MPPLQTSMAKSIDVLIICALKDEYDQVLNVNEGMISDGWIQLTSNKGQIISEATFQTSSGRPLIIQTTWASHMGREQAISIASTLINSNNVRCIAMSGICGGRRDKVSLGDVIFADRLWSYDAGKLVVEDGHEKFQGDALQYRPTDLWVQRMQHFSIHLNHWSVTRPALPLESQEDWVLIRLLNAELPAHHPEFSKRCPDWQQTLERLIKKSWVDDELNLTPLGRSQAQKLSIKYPSELPKPPDFAIHVAPIATGAKVVEDEGLFSRLSSNMRKVLGVDMEASAVAAFGEINQVPVIIAKAVSDFGDKYKDDRYRKFAAHASAQCLIKFFRDNIDLLPEAISVVNQHHMTEIDIKLITIDQLIDVLAEEYPDPRDARALWQRAGGKSYDIENVPRPRDLWQKIWQKATQGAIVTPAKLLAQVASELPNNDVILYFLNQHSA